MITGNFFDPNLRTSSAETDIFFKVMFKVWMQISVCAHTVLAGYVLIYYFCIFIYCNV